MELAFIQRVRCRLDKEQWKNCTELTVIMEEVDDLFVIPLCDSLFLQVCSISGDRSIGGRHRPFEWFDINMYLTVGSNNFQLVGFTHNYMDFLLRYRYESWQHSPQVLKSGC